MTKRRIYNNRRLLQLDRIENKVDRILSELLVIRQRISSGPDDVDVAIERMHRASRKMRAQCERERDNVRRMLISKYLK